MALFDCLTESRACPEAAVGDIEIANVVRQAPAGVEGVLHVPLVIVIAVAPRRILLAKANVVFLAVEQQRLSCSERVHVAIFAAIRALKGKRR